MLLTILFFVLCAIICYFVARKREADTIYWTLLGFGLGPLAIPFVFFAKSKNRNP